MAEADDRNPQDSPAAESPAAQPPPDAALIAALITAPSQPSAEPTPSPPSQAPPPPDAPPPGFIERVGLLPPKDKPDPYAHRRGEPRSFIALWILYVVGAIVLSLTALGARGFLDEQVYRAGLSRLMVALLAGVVLVWPMLRLSQVGPARPIRSFFADSFIILVPLLGVVLPQVLPWMRIWPMHAALCILLWCAAWALVVVGVLSNVFASRQHAPHSLRILAAAALALACMLPLGFLPFIEPRPQGAGQSLSFTSWLLPSPLTGLWDMLRDRSWSGQPARIAPQHWTAALIVLALGIALVLLAALRSVLREASAPADPAPPTDSANVARPPTQTPLN